MGIKEEFTAGFDAGYERSLPQGFLEQYHIIECLSAANDRDTLLVLHKKSGKKRVAKCYFGDAADAEGGMAHLLPPPFAAMLVFAGAYGFHHMYSRKASYAFHEPLIERAVRCSLNKPAGVITEKDLREVTELYIFKDQAYPGIDEYYEGQGKWYATDSRIRGSLSDLTDLKSMPNLRVLHIGATSVQNLTPLRRLDKLEEVSLQDNAITDISALADKPVLRYVSLLGNSLEHIEPVRTWPAVQYLNLSETGDYDGSPLEALKGIETLDVFHGPDAEKYLDGLYAETLRVGWSGQTDLSFLYQVPHVEKLWIDWSDIRDISALEGRKVIVCLYMESCAIDDLSPLFTMPNLITVEMSARQQEQMEWLIETHGQPAFEVVYTR